MNKILAMIVAIILGTSAADTVATQTDLDYVIGPIEVIDEEDVDEEYIEPYVYIEIVSPKRAVHYGEEVILRCIVVGLEGYHYRIQWQYSDDLRSDTYTSLGWSQPEYAFIADDNNIGRYYRVVVTYTK